MTILIIVESPNKTKKIEAYLGAGYKVMASVGHIRDLPVNEMGVEPPHFKPAYVSTDRSKKVISRLREAVKSASEVYLATDPDREGEAIAWHLQDTLKLKNPKRVKFNAITKDAILKAISNPGTIDMALVAAQEARRVLDRLVGYSVSPLLKSIAGGVQSLSAGRVQTPAVMLVVNIERAIANFKPVDHYKLKVKFPWPGKPGTTWSATWQHRALQKALGAEETDIFTDKNFVQQLTTALAQQNNFLVYKTEGKETFRKPPSPFSTSLLQQVANSKLGFGVDATMAAAQKLFENGLITYMRTDSLNLEEDACEEIRSWLKSKGMAVPATRNTWNSKENAQEAHEAIRPTDISNIQPSEFAPDSPEGRLYKLIWERTVACQMEPAKYFSMSAILVSALKVQGQNLQFVARGRTLISEGWLKLTPEEPGVDEDGNEKDEADGDDSSALPSLEEGARLQSINAEGTTSTTKPPARLTVGTLVKELERYGIGRPATYASIISTILARNYIETKGKKVYATKLGELTTDFLSKHFSFARLDFTKIMEGGLDKIASGEASYLKVVTYQHDMLTKEINAISGTQANDSASAALKGAFGDLVTCPVCEKGSMVRRKGNSGHYWSCSNYPACTASCNEAKTKGKAPEPDLSTVRTKSEAKPEVLSAEDCPKCKQGKLRQREGSNGPFWGCVKWPKCKATFPDEGGKPKLPA